jgi:hypothetical protein
LECLLGGRSVDGEHDALQCSRPVLPNGTDHQAGRVA